MPRAYTPRQSTLDLTRRIRALDGIARVDILPPSIFNAVRQPARIKVTLTMMHRCVDHSTSAPPCTPASTIFTLSEAREWLASEEETPLQRMQREERSGLEGYHVANTTKENR